MNKRFAPLRPWLGLIVFVALAIIAHAWLKHVMLDKQIVASLLSPGPHLPWSHAGIAIGFLMLRILVLFFLPGLILSRLGLAIYDRILAGNPKEKRNTT